MASFNWSRIIFGVWILFSFFCCVAIQNHHHWRLGEALISQHQWGIARTYQIYFLLFFVILVMWVFVILAFLLSARRHLFYCLSMSVFMFCVVVCVVSMNIYDITVSKAN